jgi:hypothetical protein
MGPIRRRVPFLISGVMSAFLALDCLFPEMWLWLQFPGGSIFEAIRATSILVRGVLFLSLLFISSMLITLGVEADGSTDSLQDPNI